MAVPMGFETYIRDTQSLGYAFILWQSLWDLKLGDYGFLVFWWLDFMAVPMGFETYFGGHTEKFIEDFMAVPMGFETLKKENKKPLKG